MLVGVLVAFTSCEKDEIGDTATVEMAGDWYVTVDAVDENGQLVYSDDELFGMGNIHVLTYNTSANDSKEMIISDMGNFWDFTVKIECDPTQLTFRTTTTEENNLVEGYDDINVTVTGGKIVLGGAVTPSGQKADSIEFFVTFSDDDYPENYGYAKYRVHGYRYTGFVEDD